VFYLDFNQYELSNRSLSLQRNNMLNRTPEEIESSESHEDILSSKVS